MITPREAIKIVRAIYRADSGLDVVVEELHRQFPGTDWAALWKREARREDRKRARWAAKQPPITLEEIQNKINQAHNAMHDSLIKNIYGPSPWWMNIKLKGVTTHGKEEQADQEAEGR